jgi:hypothetical protein
MAVTQDVFFGAIWRRIDLHLHSPGVNSFTCPNGADLESERGRDIVVQQFIEQLEKQEISICALSDYNGIRLEWFHPIKETAAQKGIVVFPGAELSFRAGKYGLHILAIFEHDCEPKEINSFIQALDRDPATPLFQEDRTHRDIDPQKNIVETLNSLRDRFGCLLIPPHPDQANGICKSHSAGDAAKLLMEVQPDAIEHCADAEIRKLISTGIVDSRFIERIAKVEFSDPKRLDEIGTKTRQQDGKNRATFLKLSVCNLAALRLALHDPATRLAVDHPPEPIHARLRKMEVSGSGFLGNLTIAWNDDLNVLIGGRGAGKSAVIETLRYILALDPYSDQPYREDLVRYALGSGGKGIITLERPIGNGKSKSYRVVRVFGEDPRVYEADTEKLLMIRPPEILGPQGGPTIFGQREIYSVSESDEYRLRLLDDLIGEEADQRAADVHTGLPRIL